MKPIESHSPSDVDESGTTTRTDVNISGNTKRTDSLALANQKKRTYAIRAITTVVDDDGALMWSAGHRPNCFLALLRKHISFAAKKNGFMFQLVWAILGVLLNATLWLLMRNSLTQL